MHNGRRAFLRPKEIRQKWEVIFMEKTDWKKEAIKLFFEEKKSIVEIAMKVGVSRKSISTYLQEVPGYSEERQRRKEENGKNRKEYQREWDRKNRSGSRYTSISSDTMRREHDLAALILSRERH